MLWNSVLGGHTAVDPPPLGSVYVFMEDRHLVGLRPVYEWLRSIRGKPSKVPIPPEKIEGVVDQPDLPARG
jgi:hypothetical protein